MEKKQKPQYFFALLGSFLPLKDMQDDTDPVEQIDKAKLLASISDGNQLTDLASTFRPLKQDSLYLTEYIKNKCNKRLKEYERPDKIFDLEIVFYYVSTNDANPAHEPGDIIRRFQDGNTQIIRGMLIDIAMEDKKFDQVLDEYIHQLNVVIDRIVEEAKAYTNRIDAVTCRTCYNEADFRIYGRIRVYNRTAA